MRSRKGPVYTTHDEDKSLVILALNGDNRAYNTLADKYKPILYTLVRRRMFNLKEEDAEDIVMEIMGKCFVALKSYNQEKSKFFTWIVACAHNHISSLRFRKKRIEGIGYEDANQPVENIRDEEGIDAVMDRENTYKLLRRLIDKLPEDIALIYKLKFFKQLPNSEVARIAGIHEKQIHYRVQKGRELLKQWLEEGGLFD